MMNTPSLPWPTRLVNTVTYCRGLPALAGALACIVGIIGGWQLFFRAEALNYGDPTLTKFSVSRATVGETIELCFADVVWHRLCQSRLVTSLTPAAGPRLDLETYRVNTPWLIDENGRKVTPQLPYRVPPKCRKWTVPDLGPNRSAGVASISGYVASQCTPLDYWWPIRTPVPTLLLDIKK